MEGEPDKYSSERDRLLDAMVNSGWGNASSGDVEAPTGFFGRISNATDDLGELIEALEPADQAAARQHAKELVGHFMVYESIGGVVTVDVYPDEPTLVADYQRLDGEYSAWLMENEG